MYGGKGRNVDINNEFFLVCRSWGLRFNLINLFKGRTGPYDGEITSAL